MINAPRATQAETCTHRLPAYPPSSMIIFQLYSTKSLALRTIAHQPHPLGYLDLGWYLAQELHPDGYQLRYIHLCRFKSPEKSRSLGAYSKFG